MSVRKEYSHYYKKVPEGVSHIDVYRVLEMFDVTDPAIAHAVKKLLVAGNRGHKNMEKDVREAVATLNRRIEMWEEQNKPDDNFNTMYSMDTIIFPTIDSSINTL